MSLEERSTISVDNKSKANGLQHSTFAINILQKSEVFFNY